MQKEIWRQLSIMGATATLRKRVAQKYGRTDLSKNTVWLAFHEEASTPLRQAIIEEGEKLLTELRAVLEGDPVAA